VTTGSPSPGHLELTVSFDADEVALSIRGDVDVVTAPDLAAVLAAVLDQGHSSVVVDLAETAFLGVAGLRIIETSARRLAATRSALSIRAPSKLVRRLLQLTGLADVVNVVDPSEHLGPTQTGPRARALTVAGELTHQLRRLTAIPADGDVVDGALRLVVALARATVGGADGVSVALNRHGRLTTVAASDPSICEIDAFQHATAEGPCIDASIDGRSCHAADLADETRWPTFTPEARRLGINAILSSPLLAGRPVGALTIYSRTPAAFAARDQHLASVLATEASHLLRHVGVDVTDVQVSDRLVDALRARQSIAHAQGVLMEREGIDEDEARTLLRALSRETSQPLRERAADIVGSTRPNPGDSQPIGATRRG